MSQERKYSQITNVKTEPPAPTVGVMKLGTPYDVPLPAEGKPHICAVPQCIVCCSYARPQNVILAVAIEISNMELAGLVPTLQSASPEDIPDWGEAAGLGVSTPEVILQHKKQPEGKGDDSFSGTITARL